MICPIISRCQQKVNFEYYTNYCSNINEDAYKKCQYYQSFIQTSKLPSEWGEYLSGLKIKT